MDDVVPVSVVERFKEAFHDRERLRQGESAAVDPVPQRTAFYILQDQVVGITDALQVVDLDDVRVARASHHLRFLHEARQSYRVGDRGRDQLLDGDFAAERRLLG